MAHRWLDRSKGDGRLRLSLWAPKEKSDEIVYHIHIVNLYAGKRSKLKQLGVRSLCLLMLVIYVWACAMRHESEQVASFEPHSLHLTWYIQLFGDQGESEELYLRDSELVQQSDVGRTDSFEFELPKLGTLSRLVIGIPAEAVGQVGQLLLDRVEERVQAIGCPLAPLEAAPSLRALPNSAHIVRMLLLHSANTALRLWWNLEPQTSRENRWNTARSSNAAGGMDRASGAHSEPPADAEAFLFASICLHELCLPVTRFAGRSPFAATPLGCKHIVTLPHAQRMEVVYQIHVLTGGLYFAGTDASVHIEIFGSKGNSGLLWLKQSQYKDKFERGQIDSFVYTFPDLGELTCESQILAIFDRTLELVSEGCFAPLQPFRSAMMGRGALRVGSSMQSRSFKNPVALMR